MDNNMMDLFNSLLSNPDTMKNLKGVLDNARKQEPISEAKDVSNDDVSSVGSTNNDLSFISDFLHQSQNSELLRKINNAYNVYSNKSTPGVRLLEALGPYLSSKRALNLEKVKNVIRMTNAFSEFNKK